MCQLNTIIVNNLDLNFAKVLLPTFNIDLMNNPFVAGFTYAYHFEVRNMKFTEIDNQKVNFILSTSLH